MSNGAQSNTKNTPGQVLLTTKQILLTAVMSIRSAEQLLVQASRATSDPATLTKISIEYNQLDSFLSQLLRAQAISDDAEFNNATAALREQASILDAEEKDIKNIVNDVAIAAKIVGYITEAMTIIAKL
jgi:gamma-glutamyl phosphate reductase